MVSHKYPSLPVFQAVMVSCLIRLAVKTKVEAVLPSGPGSENLDRKGCATRMALFLSTYTNKVDRKGRVSVPASFRAALAGEAFQGIVLFRSHGHICLEGFGQSAMEEVCGRMDHFDLFSAEQDDMATAIFGEAVQLPFDGDGRVILPEALISFAGLSEQAAFTGLGRKFQIWNPDEFEKRRRQARQNVRDKGLTLPRESVS